MTYLSYASNLVAGDTNGTNDVFVYDRQTDTTERVSVASYGTSYAGSISADGRYVTYSWRPYFRGGAANDEPTSDVFVYDRQTHVTERVSAWSPTAMGIFDGDSMSSSISADPILLDDQAVDFVLGPYAANVVRTAVEEAEKKALDVIEKARPHPTLKVVGEA